MPNILLKYLHTITGSHTKVVPVVVYGNRNYDDALIELKNILEDNGFISIAAAAFIGEHSFSTTLAKNRPDEMDMIIINQFANIIIEKAHKNYIITCYPFFISCLAFSITPVPPSTTPSLRKTLKMVPKKHFKSNSKLMF